MPLVLVAGCANVRLFSYFMTEEHGTHQDLQISSFYSVEE